MMMLCLVIILLVAATVLLFVASVPVVDNVNVLSTTIPSNPITLYCECIIQDTAASVLNKYNPFAYTCYFDVWSKQQQSYLILNNLIHFVCTKNSTQHTVLVFLFLLYLFLLHACLILIVLLTAFCFALCLLIDAKIINILHCLQLWLHADHLIALIPNDLFLKVYMIIILHYRKFGRHVYSIWWIQQGSK